MRVIESTLGTLLAIIITLVVAALASKARGAELSCPPVQIKLFEGMPEDAYMGAYEAVKGFCEAKAKGTGEICPLKVVQIGPGALAILCVPPSEGKGKVKV